MIISPPFLRDKDATQSDADWVEAMMPVNSRRGYPLNASESWHGGIHISHTDAGTTPEKVRAIADGTVVSFRKPSPPDKRDQFPLKYAPNRGTDDGYVLLKHETEIGYGEDGKVVFYSLYMHLKFLETEIKADAKIYRKDPLGSSGMTDGQNEFHFQIFCDDDNIKKLTGRKTKELDVSKDGRTDAVYGDIHFYLPAGTKFYDKAPEDNSTSITGLSELYTSNTPLYASMTLAQGSCTMVTRQKNTQIDGMYDLQGEPLVNADGEDYEYNLYKISMRNYKESPSAGFELLRFGRVINTEHETLVPADAPLWMTVNYPGGKGVVNLADPNIKKFSDADFPHWTGWQLIDDDTDSNSQCNSTAIAALNENVDYGNQCGKLICHFPFEWEKSTVDARFSWLKIGSDKHDPMSEENYAKFKAHAEALCFDSGSFASGHLWHFEPKAFIRQFKKCGWLDSEVIEKVMVANTSKKNKNALDNIRGGTLWYYVDINNVMRKYNFSDANRICHFLGQGAVESGYLLSMQEFSQQQVVVDGVQKGGKIIEASTYNETTDLGHWYGVLETEKDNYFAGKKYNSRGGYITGSYSWINGNCGDVDAQKFRGRGFKMLTGLDTYSGYWVYRGWLSSRDFDKYWWDDQEYKKKNATGMKKRPPNIISPHKVTENAYNCIDTGGFFIACFKSKVLKVMDEDKFGKPDDDSIILKVTKGINGADKGIAERKIATKKAKEVIDDEV